ncbi:hypothetical protein C2E23DRAFT_880826 [Lenzites betulinus]|nr:hypothetical protein C2E23DRAFT_880826 [Lenzites betulinus]
MTNVPPACLADSAVLPAASVNPSVAAATLSPLDIPLAAQMPVGIYSADTFLGVRGLPSTPSDVSTANSPALVPAALPDSGTRRPESAVASPFSSEAETRTSSGSGGGETTILFPPQADYDSEDEFTPRGGTSLTNSGPPKPPLKPGNPNSNPNPGKPYGS